MSAAGRWFITPHAVERYRARFHRHDGVGYEAALAELIRLSETAHPVKRKGDGMLYRGPRPQRLRAIVADSSPGQLPVLLTVYGGHDGV